MFKLPELDQTDIQLLKILQNNADFPYKQIAKLLHKSEPVIYDRIRSLRNKGYIQSSVILLNLQKIQQMLTVYVQIKLNEHSAQALNLFQETVTNFDEVMECYHMTGNYDFKLKVVIPDMPAYNNFIRCRLSAVPNLGAVETQARNGL
eukprot:gene20289-24107_t